MVLIIIGEMFVSIIINALMLEPITRNDISSNINKKMWRDEVSSSISSSQHAESVSRTAQVTVNHNGSCRSNFPA